MDWKTEIGAKFAAQGHVPDADVLEELSQHATAAYQAARAEGADPDTANRAVQTLVASWCGDASSLRRRPRRPPVVEPPGEPSSPFAGIAHDARYAVRLLMRQPGFALVVILTMALGIGATTTLFSVAYGVLLKPLPWPDADRLVRVSESRQGSTRRMTNVLTNATYLAWREAPSTIDELAGWSTQTVTLAGSGDAERLHIAAATPSLFPLLRAQPLLGTAFRSGDDRNPVAIVSYGLWQQRFGGSADILGRSIQLDQQPYTIVAVMPRDFVFPDRDTRAWIPFHVPSVVGDTPGSVQIAIFGAMARLRPGATAAQASAEATARARGGPSPGLAAVAMFGSAAPPDVSVVPALDALTADVRPALSVFFVAVALLLITATANVASLQLARATVRRREIAIRSALGAGGARLARQLLVESVVLGLAGGVIGLVLAGALHRALPSVLPADFPRLDDVAIDGRVMAFALGLSLVTSVAFGLWPALQVRRLDLVQGLTEDGLAPSGGGGRSPTARVRALIMAGQIAIACVLLLGAGLLGRSFISLMRADRGYDPANVLTARLLAPSSSYTPQRRAALLTTMLDRLRAIPGVRQAAFSSVVPLMPGETFVGFRMPSHRPPAGALVQVQAGERIVSDGYFSAMGRRLVQGRAFAPADTTSSVPAMIVNRAFARRYLTDAPLGEKIPRGLIDDKTEWEVVGVVDDVQQPNVSNPVQPEMFVCYRQLPGGVAESSPNLVIRTAGDPIALVPTLKALVRGQDSSLVLESIMTMDDRIMTTLAKPRLYALLLGGFAVFALVIAGVGLFGVLSYSVAQRSREIGVRTALGAQTADIVALVLRQAAAMTAGGLAVGLWTSFVLVKYLSTFLYGVTVHDWVSFVAVPAILAVVTAIACVVPARRAARVDPLKVLRAN
jgi:putative ABC transport system permease protein